MMNRTRPRWSARRSDHVVGEDVEAGRGRVDVAVLGLWPRAFRLITWVGGASPMSPRAGRRFAAQSVLEDERGRWSSSPVAPNAW